jgi:hypothetical protein
MGEGPVARDAGDPRGDAVRLIRADPDRDEAVGVLRLEKNDMLTGEDVDAHRLDGAEDQARSRD